MENLLKKLNQEKITQYQAHLEKLDLSEATIKRRLSVLRKFYNWAEKEGYLEKPPQKAPIAKEAPSMPTIPFISDAYEVYHSISITKYLHYAILIIFCTALGFGIYQQFIARAPEPLAYPTALTRPNRYLSFQGRLTDSSNNPITTSTNFVFKLYDASTDGNTLWNSGTCAITPDQDGIFSVILGLNTSCGAEITSSVFTENSSVWLGITVGADSEATPRIQVATVAYALNAETLQGYPPGTGTSNVPYIDSTGKVVIAAASPTVQATSGTFSIEGQTGVTIQAASGQNGNINLTPKGTGRVVATFEASTGNLLDIQGGANIGGSGGKEANTIIYGYAGTDSTNLNLLKLEAGATPDAKFTVDASGNASMAGSLKIETINSVSDNNVVLTSDSGTVKYIDTSNWDKSASDDVAGSGTANYIPKWQNSNTLTNSILYETASKIGIGTTNPTEELEVVGDAKISGHAAIGSNASVQSAETLDISEIYTNTSGSRYNIYSDIYANPTANSSGDYTSVWGSSNSSSGNSYNVDTLRGGYFLAGHDGSGTASNEIGVYSRIDNAGGPATSARVFEGYLTNSNTISTAYGVYLALDNSGTIANTYGVYIGDITAGTQTNTPYSFYASDPNAYNYFAGNVGIGTTNPSYLLDVAGNVNIGGTGTIGNIPLVSDNNRVLTSASAGSGIVQYIDTSNWDKSTADDYVSWLLAGDSGTPQNIGAGDTATIAGGIGIGTTTSATDTLTINVDESYGFAWTGTQSWAGSADFNSDVSINDASIALDNATATNLAVTGDFSINTNDFFVEKSSGYVGIGKTSPNNQLDVAGTVEMTGFKMTTSPSAGFVLTSDASGVGSWTDVSSSAGPWTLADDDLYPDDTSYNVAIGANDAGTAKLYVNGNVGIGTTGPAYLLDVNGLAHAATAFVVGTNPSGTGGIRLPNAGVIGWRNAANSADLGAITLSASNSLDIVNSIGGGAINISGYTTTISTYGAAYPALIVKGASSQTADLQQWQNSAGIVLAVVDKSGNVGIGTTAPGAKLDVVGTGRFYDSTPTTGVTTLTLRAGAGQATSPLFQWQNNAGTGLGVIDASGNVGIGTTAPTSQARLHVKPASVTGDQRIAYFGDDITNAKALVLGYNFTSNYGWINPIEENVAWTDLVLVPSGGQVGIGTDPDEKLVISDSGNTKIKTISTTAGNQPAFTLQNSGNTNAPYFEFQLIPSNTDKESYVRYNYVGATSTTDILVIKGTGKVGIGDASPEEELDVVGNATISGTLALGPNAPAYAGTCDASAKGKMYYNGTNDQVYYCNGSSWVVMGSASSVFGSGNQNYIPKWQDSSTLTDSIIYETGGQIGIGTTGPSDLLHIYNGSLRVQPTSDADIDLLKVGVTGTPTLSWDESRDTFSANKGIDVLAGNLTVGDPVVNRTAVGPNSVQIFSGDAGNNALMVRAAASQTADIVQVQNSAGTGLVVIDNSGNVGIGDASPASLFTVGSGDKFQVGTSGNLTINTGTSATVITAERSANGYVIETNVGGTPGVDIGTEGGVGHAVIAFKNTDILVGKSGTSGLAFGSGVSWSDVPAGASDINIKGNVGIGTTGPTSLLTVNGNTEIRTGGYLRLRPTNNAYNWDFLASGNDLVIYDGGTARHIFQMGGNVGIGTTSPSSLLSVGASSQFQVNTSGDIIKLKNLTYSWPSSQVSGGFLRDTNGSGTLEWTTTVPATSVSFANITSGTNTQAAMVVGTGASLTYHDGVATSGEINASLLQNANWAAPLAIGGTTPAAGNFTSIGVTTQGTGAFTTLTSSGNSTIGTGASSINTIGSTTTPGTLTLHGATTLDNTFTVSGSNLTSLGGNLTVTGTVWTATPTISGLVTMTSGFDSNAASTVTNLTIDGTSGTALNISNTGITTDINLQYGETIDNDVDGSIRLGSTTLTLNGTTTLTASSLATFTSAAALNMSSTTSLTLGDNATLYGSDIANGNLTLEGTSNATKTTSYVILQPTSGNVGIGTTGPTDKLTVAGNIDPSADNSYDLGDTTNQWRNIYTQGSIYLAGGTTYYAGDSDGDGYFRTIGVGTAPSATATTYSYRNETGNSTYYYATNSIIYASHTADAPVNTRYYGLLGTAYQNSTFAIADAEGIVAVKGLAGLNNTGTVSSAIGVSGTVNPVLSSGTTTLTSGYGIKSAAWIAPTTTANVNSLYLYYGSNPSGSGTWNISNLYGLYLEAINEGTSQNYGIYVDAGDIVLDADGDGAAGGTGAGGDLVLGEGQDLELYHDGTNSYIMNNTGYLVVSDGGGNDLVVNAGNVGIGTTAPGAYKLNIAGTTMHQNAVYFANGTTYYVDASGNAKFLDLIAADTGNPGLTVGDGSTGYLKVGGSTISDAAGDLTLNSDSGNVTISDANLILDDGSSTSYYIKTRSTTSPTNTTLYINNPGTGNANLNIEGDLTVTGNDILDAGGSSAITFDGTQNTALAGNLTMQDDKWIGLGSSAGRIEFDGTPATDEVNILDANVGIGTTGPDAKLDILSTTDDNQLRLTRTDGSIYTNLWMGGDSIFRINTSGGYMSLEHAGANQENRLSFENYAGGAEGAKLAISNAEDFFIQMLTNKANPDPYLTLQSTGGMYFDIDTNADETDRRFIFRSNSPAAGVFSIDEGGNFNSSNQTIDWTLNNAADALNIDSNTLSIDALNNRVGIGTAGPWAKLEVAGTGNPQLLLVYDSSHASGGTLGFYAPAGGADAQISTSNFGLPGPNAPSGLLIKTSGGGDQLYLKKDGNVGIGTTSPQSALQVNGTISLNDTNTQIWEDGSSNLSFKDAVAGTKTLNELVTATSFGQLKHLAVQVTGDGTQYKDYTWTHGMGVTPSAVIATIDMTAVGDSWIVNTYNPGTTTVSFRIYRRDGGNWSNTLNLRALGIWPASGADLAEYFPTNEDPESLEPGTLISMNPDNPTYIKKSDKVYDELLLGIVPTDPGMVIGEETEGNRQLIALSGRVPALVTLEEGKILPGDFITSSSIPGYGMKINSYRGGPAVGIALEGFDPAIDSSKVIPCPSGFEHQTCGKIMVFVNRTTHDPQIYLTDAGDLEIAGSQASAGADSQKFELKDKEGNLITRIGAFSEAVIAELRAGLIKSQEIVTEKLASKEVQTEKLISPLVETKKIQTERISLKDIEAKPGEDIVIDLASSEQRLASSSGFGKLVVKGKDNKEVVSIDAQGNATFAGELRAKKIVAEEIVGLEGKFGELLASTSSATYITQNITNITQVIETTPSPTPSPIPSPTPTPLPEPGLPATESGEIDALADIELSPDIEALVDEILNTSLEATPQTELANTYGDSLKIANGLTVLGTTSLADTSIAGSLNIGGTMNLSDNSINSLTGPLYLQNLGLGGIDILAGKIVIDQQGNATFEGNVTIKGRLALSEIEPLPEGDLVINLESGFGKLLVKGIDDKVVASIDASGSARFAQVETQKIVIASDQTSEVSSSTSEVSTNATAGQAVLPAGATEITIKSGFVTDKTLVYVTPISDTQNKVLFVEAKKGVTDQEPGWFKVGIDTPIGQDIQFNWWIIN